MYIYVPQGKAKGNIEVKGKQNSLFPMGPAVIKCFVTCIPPRSLNRKDCKEMVCFTPAGSQINYLLWFNQGAWPDHVWVKSLSCCFPGVELVSFDTRHMTRFPPPIGKRIWVGRYNNNDYCITGNNRLLYVENIRCLLVLIISLMKLLVVTVVLL